MPIPAGVEKVTVTDGGVPLTGPDGTPLDGSFTVTGPDLATVPADDYLFGGSARRWVTAGLFDPVTLVATDATGINPTGFSYTVEFTPKHGKSWTRYFQLPKATPAVVLADILIPDPVAGSYTVLADPSALLPKAGGTMTGGLVMDGANITVERVDGTGAFRFRVTGSGLDLEVSGLDVIVSHWSGADFTGTQTNLMRWEAAGPHLIGRTQFGTGAYDDVHDIDPATGVASLGAKNGLTNIRLAGFKNTAGAPAAGAWNAGDVVLDASGAWHLCTASGTPGTWT